MKYSTILFDLDGTLTDPEQGICGSVRYALEKAGITDVTNAVMIGDREYDILGAKENGLDSIGVLYGYGRREELEAAGAGQIAETVEELWKILQG